MSMLIGATMWAIGAAMAYRVTDRLHRREIFRRRLYG
jgi:hypothetical protein